MKSGGIVIGLVACLALLAGCVMPPPAVSTPPQARVTISPQFNPGFYSRVAIYVENFAQRRLDKGVMRAVEDEFARAAIAKGYMVAARSDMDAIDRELQLQASDVTEAAMAKRARALNVPAIILVSLNGLDVEQYDPYEYMIIRPERPKRAYRAIAAVSARMISAAEGQVIWLSSFTGSEHLGDNRDGGRAAQSIVPVAAVVAGSMPSRGL